MVLHLLVSASTFRCLIVHVLLQDVDEQAYRFDAVRIPEIRCLRFWRLSAILALALNGTGLDGVTWR